MVSEKEMRIMLRKGKSFQKGPIQEYGKRAPFASFVLLATNSLRLLYLVFMTISLSLYSPTLARSIHFLIVWQDGGIDNLKLCLLLSGEFWLFFSTLFRKYWQNISEISQIIYIYIYIMIEKHDFYNLSLFKTTTSNKKIY
jgi:hypothetical protein